MLLLVCNTFRFSLPKGDVDSLWKVEQLRSECMKQHTLSSGFSCVKVFHFHCVNSFILDVVFFCTEVDFDMGLIGEYDMEIKKLGSLVSYSCLF